MSLFNKDEYDYIYDDVDISDSDESEDIEDAIERIRGTIEEWHCPYCRGSFTMKHDGPCFVCTKCKTIIGEDCIYREVAGYPIEVKSEDLIFDESYEDVYSEDGDTVSCDYCSALIKWKNGQYICPNCEQVMGRSEFFNYIGAEPPGSECLTCDGVYPRCVTCRYGYDVDDYI